LKGRIDRIAVETDWRPLVTLYEEYHSKVLTALDAVEKVARRDLPREIKDRNLFAGKTKTVTTFLSDLRAKLVTAHDMVMAEITQVGVTIDQAKTKIKSKIDDAVAEIVAAADAMQALTDEGATLVRDADGALKEFGSDLQKDYDDAIDRIHAICRDATSTIPVIKKKVEDELKALSALAVVLKSKVDQAAKDVLAALGGLLDEVGVAVDDQEKKLELALKDANDAASTAIGALEQKFVDAVDKAINELRGQASNLAAAIAKASDQLKQGAADIVNGLRDKIPPGLADDIRVLEEGYKRLSNAPTFQNPSETLALIRAAGSSPILPNLKFNRERIAYFFDDARDAVQSSPVVGLVNRLGDDLKALGIRVPTNEFLDRLIPKDLENYDFGKLFPDLGGLKLDGLFKNVRLPSLNNRSRSLMDSTKQA
jgi:hypothetical protein